MILGYEFEGIFDGYIGVTDLISMLVYRYGTGTMHRLFYTY